ncbi:hypothetical protein VCCP1040_1209, partial [Vibrio cholerae CP1040(13)]
MLTRWNQTFDQSHFCIFVDLVVTLNHGFQQNVHLLATDQSLGGRHTHRLGRP